MSSTPRAPRRAGWSRCGVAALAAAAALASGACANYAGRADRLAAASGFQKTIETGGQFRHVVYRNSRATGGVLHVYIEGDGTPYERRDAVAADPTPRRPLMLQLMALDPAASIYVGRPCYFGLYRDPGCSPELWTLRRYSPEVLDSLERIVRSQSTRLHAAAVQIYGHSGGGSLAVLLGQRLQNVSTVITLGANLDIAAWCKLHGYTPLAGSINPTDVPSTRPDLRIIHWVGADDTNTPPALIEAAARARGGETVSIVPGADHRCCWQPLWAQILQQTSAR